jgi:hypothetical protein
LKMAPFVRTVGAGADLKELEYIAALHQTCVPETRASGTVSTLDIQRFLLSRHGLDISHGKARDIVRGLGGGVLSYDVVQSLVKPEELATLSHKKKKKALWKHKAPEEVVRDEEAAQEVAALYCEFEKPALEYLDVVQLMSIIIIPTLARFEAEWKERQNLHEDIKPSEFEPSQTNPNDNIKGAEIDSAILGIIPVGAVIAPLLMNSAGVVNKFGFLRDPDSLRPKPAGLIGEVLQSLWRDTDADDALITKVKVKSRDDENENPPLSVDASIPIAPVLTTAMVQFMLSNNGEHERAKDTALIQKMVDVAKSPSGRFDEEALMNALTSDLRDWDVGCEDRTTTYIYDIFGTDDLVSFQRLREAQAPTGSEEAPDQDDDTVALLKKKSGRVFDSVVDEYGSYASLLLIWFFYICCSAILAYILTAMGVFDIQCSKEGDTSFGCILLSTIWRWYVCD